MSFFLSSTPLGKEPSEIRLSPQIWKDESRPLKSSCTPNEISDLAFVALSGENTLSLSALLGSGYSFEPKRHIHPAHIDCHRSIIRNISKKGSTIFASEIPIKKDNVSSVLIIGGPVYSLQSRLILGEGGCSPLMQIDLPVKFSIPGYNEPIRDYSKPWEIVINGQRSSKDCMVITSIPFHGKDRIVNIAGRSHSNQISTEKILKNKRLLENLYKKTRLLTGWQAVIELDMSFNGSSKESLEIFEISNVNFESERYDLGINLLFSHTSGDIKIDSEEALLALLKNPGKGRTIMLDSQDIDGATSQFLARKDIPIELWPKVTVAINEAIFEQLALARGGASGLSNKQKMLVEDFTKAIQEGKAATAAFMHRFQEAERVKSWRDMMSPETKSEQRAKDAERARNWRRHLTDEEAAERRAKDAARKRAERAKPSPA